MAAARAARTRAAESPEARLSHHEATAAPGNGSCFPILFEKLQRRFSANNPVPGPDSLDPDSLLASPPTDDSTP